MLFADNDETKINKLVHNGEDIVADHNLKCDTMYISTCRQHILGFCSHLPPGDNIAFDSPNNIDFASVLKQLHIVILCMNMRFINRKFLLIRYSV